MSGTSNNKGVLRYESMRDLDHTRQTLLEAGARVFAEKGLAGTRIDDLVQASGGVNRSMIYYIFGSKHDLYREVLKAIMLHMREEALAVLHPETIDLSRDLLHTAILAMFDTLSKNPDWARLLLREVLDGADDLRAIAAETPNFHMPKRIAISLLSQVEGNVLFKDDNTYAFILFVQTIPMILPIVEPILDVLFPDGMHRNISKESWRSFLVQVLERFSQKPPAPSTPSV